MALRDLLEIKWAVSSSVFLFLILYPGSFMATMVVGSISNSLFSKVLKRAFNHARPAGAQEVDPGMPSSHACALFFFSAFLSTAAADMSRERKAAPFAALSPALVAGALFGFALVASLYRVHVGLHTFAQIAVGALIGSLFGCGWFFSADRVINPMLDSLQFLGWQLTGTVGVLLLALIGWWVVSDNGRSLSLRKKAS